MQIVNIQMGMISPKGNVIRFTVFEPTHNTAPSLTEPEDMLWNVYDDDSKGNGNFLFSAFTLDAAFVKIHEYVLNLNIQ